MENKKLVKILLRDMGELEELIAEMKSKRQFDALTLEFIHTRAKGISQVLQMLESNETDSPEAMHQMEETTKKPAGMSDEAASGQEEIKSGKEVQKAPPVLSPAKNEAEPEKATEQEKKPESEKEPAREKKPEPVQAELPEDERASAADEAQDDDDMLEEDSEENHAGARLGDSFLKGKSINDLITEQQKLEFKLSNRPVSSIRSAIGINDRFQYIRELFDGDNQKFLDTVKNLDAMDNITEAVNYLRTHFRWKKNETSLKFVNLLKRRFIHG